jgi:N-acetylglucosaminyl-diphospho-decaprenol L-rhamnosyltransferase
MRPDVTVVVVSYNSSDSLRACLEPLAGQPGIDVVVVDNASPDDSLAVVGDLPVTALQLDRNGGFAYGCNVGWRSSEAPFILFLNPDARIDPRAVRTLVSALEHDDSVGAVGPRIVNDDGTLDFSRRRFPRLSSTFSQALFLHRVFPRALWTDETIRREDGYAVAGEAEWLSGACLMARRTLLERLDGLDEGFFMYCEDKDLCRRCWDAGARVWYEPAAVVVHEGGASAPRSSLLPVLAASKVRYARKHRRPVLALAERLGLALGELTHVIVSRGGRPSRAGHLAALAVVAGIRRPLLPGARAG